MQISTEHLDSLFGRESSVVEQQPFAPAPSNDSRERSEPLLAESKESTLETDKLESVDISDEVINKILLGTGDYAPIELNDAVELLHTFHPLISTGQYKLYDWQAETLRMLCHPNAFTREFPLHFILCACNGSGKDAFVTAPFAVWSCVSKIRSRTIITSSSFNQLKNQTEPSIRSIAASINKYLGDTVLIIKQFHIINKNTGSEILMFATDDPGMAEGYHPFPDWPNAEMALIVNEAKTVREEIFGALKRCNGYNRWIEVSSPGKMSGHLYQQWKRCLTYPARYKKGETVWYGRRVTAYDCDHISKSVIEDDKIALGESSPLFRSMYLAEFTDLTENAVIPADIMEACLLVKREDIIDEPSAGIDMSFGGSDECAGYCVNGNKILDFFAFKGITDTIVIKDRIKMHLDSWKNQFGLKPDRVAGDDGNAGKSVIDMLHREGWQIRRVVNQSRAINNKQFANRGAELYWNVRRLVEERFLKFDELKHAKVIDQLKSRRYKQHAIAGTIVLESKKDAREHGVPSPDHGDAYVLAQSFRTIHDFVKEKKEDEKKITRFTLREIEEQLDPSSFQFNPEVQVKRAFYGSVSSVLTKSKCIRSKV